MGKSPAPRPPAARRPVVSDAAGVPLAPPPADPFDWAALQPAERSWLRGETEAIITRHARMSGDYLWVGRRLLAAKARLPHGQFVPWVEAEMPFSKRTAQEMMQAARVFGGGELPATGAEAPEAGSDRPEAGDSGPPAAPPAAPPKSAVTALLTPTAMAILAAPSVPAAVRQEAVQRTAAGQHITAEAAKAMVAAAPREEREPRPRLFSQGTPETQEAAEVVRGSMIDRLDEAYTGGRLGELLWRDSPDPRLRDHGRDVFQELCLVLFPESFSEPTTADSLCPPAGPRRAGQERLMAFAEMLRAKK